MTAVRPGPTHAAPAGSPALSPVPGPVPDGHSTGRHARVGSGVPSGPLVRLRTVVPAPEPTPEPSGRLVIDSSYCRLSPHLGAAQGRGERRRPAAGGSPGGAPRSTCRRDATSWRSRSRAGATAGATSPTPCPVAAGHTVEVFYRAPALPRLAGSLGPARQRTAGFPVCAVLLALGGLAVLALLVAALVLLVA